MTWNSPFASTVASPGKGEVVLSLLPPSIPTLTTLTYKYPLKLLSRAVGFTPESSVLPPCAATRPIHLYLLTYGGGLLPGDQIDVSITLHARTRLVVTTPQGSTKIFKTTPSADGRRTQRSDKDDMSRQVLDVRIGSQAALCYLPDPTAPFKDSRYEQVQRFTVDGDVTGNERSSLCVLDWVTQGRTSRGEDWDFHFWKGKNEVWSVDRHGEKRRLLLRDSVILDDETRPGVDVGETDNSNTLIRERTRPHGIVGTLILCGPVFDNLASFIIQTFTSQPRIGGRNWSSSATDESPPATKMQQHDVIWTAARVRAGFVLVKFGAKDFETARDWLGSIIREEGSIIREFGEEALFCL
ncbi:urease accessory protein UreD [Paecilomyces variotii No. 5]|uniref:Urease accessory protein UreD n=1 Tax=Byssochlamys spectabilis (strain No. 5 / NBRC 109023) TaxID=1356009 RepID=V5FQ35_BYSSN|nr:urease accessory protein UreD [Paecilomyces variotii No. 5]